MLFEARCSGEQGDDFLLEAAGDVDLAVGVDEDVDFAADAEFGVVDAGFDGEAGAGEDEAFVVGFEVVEVGAIAVDFLTDGVAGAVDEGGSVAGGFDDVAGRAVEFPALEGAAVGVGLPWRWRWRRRERGRRWRRFPGTCRGLSDRRRRPW